MTHPHVKYAMKIPGIYSEEELESLRQEIEALPAESRILEIGVLYGRTASLYMQAALEKSLTVTLIDNWCVNGSDARPYFTKLVMDFYAKLDAAVTASRVRSDIIIWEEDSTKADLLIAPGLDLIHIDGNHHDPGPQLDCQLYLPKLKSGCVAVFHDYNTLDVDGKSLVFPGLHEAVDFYTAGWKNLGVIHSQTKRRKP